MRISAIVPNFNDTRVERALAHLVSQTHADKQIVVVDGGSSKPQVHEIYRQFMIDRLIVEPDRGIFDALNKGVDLADGEIIFLQGADDFLPDQTTFAEVSRLLDADPLLDGVCIGCRFVDENEKVIRIWHTGKVTATRILLGLYPPHFSLFLKRTLYDKIGPFQFEESKNIATDSLWLIDLARKRATLRIPLLKGYHLKMEYGGASTGSWGGILKQFLVVFHYVKEKNVRFWLIHPFVKVISKFFQFTIGKKK